MYHYDFCILRCVTLVYSFEAKNLFECKFFKCADAQKLAVAFTTHYQFWFNGQKIVCLDQRGGVDTVVNLWGKHFKLHMRDF